jgi:hypothetical protein
MHFKVYESQLPVIEQALETAALMLCSDKSRGYCLEMICVDFLAGSYVESGDSKALRLALGRLFGLLPFTDQEEFLDGPKRPRVRLDRETYSLLHRSVLGRDAWQCQNCGSRMGLEVRHIKRRSHLGHDAEENLITLCRNCHREVHMLT